MPRTLSSSIVKVFPCTSVERFSVALRSSTHVVQAHVRSLRIGRLFTLPSTDEQERLEPWASLTVPPRSWHDQGRLAVCRKVNMEQTLAARNAASQLLRWERSTPMTADANLGKPFSRLRAAMSRRLSSRYGFRSSPCRGPFERQQPPLRCAAAPRSHEPRAEHRGLCDHLPECTQWPTSRALALTGCHRWPSGRTCLPNRHYHILRRDFLARLAQGFLIKNKFFGPHRVSMSLSETFMSATMELAAPSAGASTCALPGRSSCFPSGVGAGFASMSCLLSREGKILRQVDKSSSRQVFWEIFLCFREHVVTPSRNDCGDILHKDLTLRGCV